MALKGLYTSRFGIRHQQEGKKYRQLEEEEEEEEEEKEDFT